MSLAALGTAEHVNLTRYTLQLQQATDAAAITAARELRLLVAMPNVNLDAEMTRAARGIIDSNLRRHEWPIDLEVAEIEQGLVQVDAWSDVKPMFGAFYGAETKRIEARAVARILGGEDVCAVALGEKDDNTLDLNNDSSITGEGCSIYSNSAHPSGLSVSDNAVIKAAQICSAGGARGASSGYSPQAITDCPPLQDPLEHKLDDIAAAAAGPCKSMLGAFLTGVATGTAKPGRYCDDITIDGHTTLTLDPGVYVFDNSVFEVSGNATLKGEDVALVFIGNNSRMIIGGEAEVGLSGRVSGDMAGMLMISELRKDDKMREFTITSPNVSALVGTIYLPGDYLNILTSESVAADSAFTVVMAKRIKLHGSASLVLNRDYSATTVPKSEGLREYGGGLLLVQ